MPYDLEEAAQALVANVEGFETRTLQRIGARIKKTGQLNSADEQALRNMANIGVDLDAIYANLANVTVQNIEAEQRILIENMMSEMERSKSIFAAKGVPFISYENNEFAQQMVRNWAAITGGKMLNLSRTKAIGFTKEFPNGRTEFTPIEGAFQQAIDKAVVAVRTGTTDFATAMRDTVNDLGGSGIVVNYGSGVTRRLDSMVRQNLLWGAKQSAQEYHNYIGEQFGANGFEVDYHPHPRPSHAVIGGRMFALGDTDVIIDGEIYTSAEKDLEGNGSASQLLDDYGCLHFALPVLLGISQSRYSKEWLAEQKEKDKEIIEYTKPDGSVVKGTRYDFTQRQRALERGIRESKREAIALDAAGFKQFSKMANDRVKALRAAYDDLSKQTGLQPKKERMTVSGYKWKSVDNSVKSGNTIRNTHVKQIIDVTKEYLQTATPGKGTIIYDDNYSINKHKDEIKTAEWLHNTFGGDIRLLKESEIKNIMTPDFIWNNKNWELKGSRSINGADKSLQHAIKQIQDNPGGVIVNVVGDIDMNAMEQQLVRRIRRSKTDGFDLMILSNDKLVKILRYKK